MRPGYIKGLEDHTLPALFLSALYDLTVAIPADNWWRVLAQLVWQAATDNAHADHAAEAGTVFAIGSLAAHELDDIADIGLTDPLLFNSAVALSHSVPLLIRSLFPRANSEAAILAYQRTVLRMSGGQHIDLTPVPEVSVQTLEISQQAANCKAHWLEWGCGLAHYLYPDAAQDLASVGYHLGLAHQLQNDYADLAAPELGDIRSQKPTLVAGFAHYTAIVSGPPEAQRYMAAWKAAPDSLAAAQEVAALSLAWGARDYICSLQEQALTKLRELLGLRCTPALLSHIDLVRVARND